MTGISDFVIAGLYPAIHCELQIGTDQRAESGGDEQKSSASVFGCALFL
jgi:hypothetical protein